MKSLKNKEEMPFKFKKKRSEYGKWRYRELKKGSWSTSRRSKYKMWIKKDIKKVMELWNTHTTAELCKVLNRKKGQIVYMGCQIRKHGYPLSKKLARGVLGNLIKEAIKEYKGRGKNKE